MKIEFLKPAIHPFIKWLMRTFEVHGEHSAVFDVKYQVIKYRAGHSQPYEWTPWTEPNLVVTAGLTHLVRLATGELTTTLTNAAAQLGAGDSSTAAAAGQTDLQAASNKTWTAMDATYPTAVASNATIFQSTFAAGSASYAWNEVGIARGAATILIGRRVQSFGTKGAGDSWILRSTLTATSS